MRKSVYFLFLYLAFIFSCSSNKESMGDLIEEGAPTRLTINLVGAAQSKASGNPTSANESKIAKGVIFVFKGNVSNPPLDGMATFDFTSGVTPVSVNITAGTYRHVYVIANVNPSDLTGIYYRNDLYNVANKAAITGLRTKTNLPMSAYQTNIDASASAPSITVPLKFICSRVSIDWSLDAAAPSGLAVSDAYLLNVRNYSDYFAGTASSLTENTNSYLYGKSDISSFTGGDPTTSMLPSAPPVEYNTYDVALGMGGDLTQKGYTNNHFYIFENSNYLSHTLVVIEATQGGSTYYYPIIINGEGNTSGGNNSSNVVRGKIYNVKALIKGFGNTDPYSPIQSSAMNVTITAASWDPTIEITQEFN